MRSLRGLKAGAGALLVAGALWVAALSPLRLGTTAAPW